MTRESVLAHVAAAGPADAEGIARVHEASWAATYTDKLPPQVIRRAAAVWGAGHWRKMLSDPGDRCVLILDSESHGIVGFVSFGPQRGTVPDFAGEIYALYLLPGAERQGAGSALLRAAARVMIGREMPSALVWTLSSNRPARHFYEAMGGKPIGPRMTKLFGEEVAEAAYGWSDLESLAVAD